MQDTNLIEGAAHLAQALLQRNWSLATAESCSGGWIAKVCTDLAGSSAWFERGYVTYSNQAKHQDLGVRVQTLDKFGAVSAEVAQEMAVGAQRRSGADIALAVTGIAGPEGGSSDKPVGTVWFGFAGLSGQVKTVRRVFPGDRDQIRRQTVLYALTEAQCLLKKDC